MVTPMLLNVNPQECNPANISCFGLNPGQSAGLGIGLFTAGLAGGILGTLLVLLLIKLCCSKSTTPNDSSVSYGKQKDEASVR